ncbi:hypothetical protein AOLI_G00091370 [Acnodon oligacanthus]
MSPSSVLLTVHDFLAEILPPLHALVSGGGGSCVADLSAAGLFLHLLDSTTLITASSAIEERQNPLSVPSAGGQRETQREAFHSDSPPAGINATNTASAAVTQRHTAALSIHTGAR